MNPNLIEPGTKYFIHKSLEQCKKIKYSYYNTLFNIGVFFVFLSFVFIFCYYGYREKKHKKVEANEEYIHSLIEKIQQEQEEVVKKELYQENTITNLPPINNYFMDTMKKFL